MVLPAGLGVQLGNLAQAELYLAALREHCWIRSADLWTDLCCSLTAEAGAHQGQPRWLDIARNPARQILASPPVTGLARPGARQALGLSAAEDHDAGQAAEQYPTWRACTNRWAPASTARLLGIIAQAAGLLDKAAAHFEVALAFNRQAGYRPELAWTCCDYADLLRERNGPGDAEKAAALLDEGIAIARDLGMKPLMERILARRKILKA